MSTPDPSFDHYRCLVAERDHDGNVHLRLQKRAAAAASEGELTIRVSYSSLNYKDALASTGHPGVARSLPLVPGIDAAGTVIHSTSSQFRAGDSVLIFHARFGTEVDGGYSEFVSVPAAWVYSLPSGLDPLEAMTIGTAGFTAAQCVDELMRHGIQPGAGDIVVSGATGGVGIFAVKLLAKLGYRVVAATGKEQLHEWLRLHGAQDVISRQSLNDLSPKPLLPGRWAGAVDTVGGNTLATIVRGTKPYGCVTACGVAGGAELPLTVYPFILRGVTLQGIDTAGISREYRAELWNRLATLWRLMDVDKLATVVDLADIPAEVPRILAGGVAGRVVVRVASDAK